MLKKIFVLVFSVLLAQGFSGAQISMNVPYGSFEQWTSHNGYSVTALFLPVSVYSSYSTPTGWDYLSYPVNESVSVMGANININTNLPLIKSSQETGTVPDGNSAVKLQTFMLSDIISSMVYSVAAGSIDTMLTNMVFPSILSTGSMDIDHFIPIINSLMSNMDSMEALLTSLADVDVNYYFNGGIAVDGFDPTRLTGSYKYHSAVSGDNGGVLMLGTRYNSTLNKRELVGGGININLTDCTEYTPFTVDYMSLNEYDATYAQQDPDSLIIMLVSSASLDRQQGSYLCIDNLVLWHDTCADVAGLTVTSDIHEAALSWNSIDAVAGFELEYGVSGFVQGTGTLVTLGDTSYSLNSLAANTQYDVYLHSVCSNGIYGDWEMVSFTTLQDTCASVTSIEVVSTSGVPSDYSLEWSASSEPEGWEVEYGLRGFIPGNGTLVTLTEQSLSLSSLDLHGNNWYDFYVRSVCSDNVYGDWSMVQFHTDPDTCAVITSIELDSNSVEITPNNMVSGYVVSWTSSFEPEGWELEYGTEGFETGAGISAVAQSATYAFGTLLPGSRYEVRIRAVCNDSIYGDWVSMVFSTRDTLATVSIDNPQLAFFDLQHAIFPNPASGRCVVKLPDGVDVELRLYSADGRLLQSLIERGTSVVLQLPSKGVFLLQVTSAGGTQTCKIVNR